MTTLLEQFLCEARESLEAIAEKLIQLEQSPGNAGLMNELFRLVHTLKGNSGLFEFPEMTRVLHAGEDLMVRVRNGQVAYSQGLADHLLEAMDFVGLLCAEIESAGEIKASHGADSSRLAEALRVLIVTQSGEEPAAPAEASCDPGRPAAPPGDPEGLRCLLAKVPESVRAMAWRCTQAGEGLHMVTYRPLADCFYQGDDPFFTARLTPGLLWGGIAAREPWAPLADLDAYRCALEFCVLTTAPREELVEHYRYVPDQAHMSVIDPRLFGEAHGESGDQATDDSAMDDGATGDDAADDDAATVAAIYAAQRRILLLDDDPAGRVGRLEAVGRVLDRCCQAAGDPVLQGEVAAALARSRVAGDGGPLLAWLDARDTAGTRSVGAGRATPAGVASLPAPPPATEAIRFRATDNQPSGRSLKVDQEKIDRLMDLIGEIVVFKNSLPYLAQRADNHFGVRDLAREITTQYGVINRIAEEMQGAIMQVRMMPVSFIFQRFPRLVRDISRNLGKDVQLVLLGEETEADKNIIESLADPLIHIVRNSLDHGLEGPEIRRAVGKPTKGTLTIRASQEADRVLIEIDDDGAGIDPAKVKNKAYEKGVIDEATLERITDQEAINLVFAAGFSTVDVATDLSGRGVGMDVVRTAVAKVNGTIELASELGKGTRIRISLPLSMAVTKVMIVEADDLVFGVPMDHVLETVRVPRASIRSIKQCQMTALRGRTLPLKALTALLGVAAEPKANADDELAVLVARTGAGEVGLIVDGFREAVDVIQKPLFGALAGLAAYSGSALMGDGSVLMVLNVKEIV